ncbi:hypothetical protein Q9189_006365 [Teloschistes chrysophthalmus]
MSQRNCKPSQGPDLVFPLLQLPPELLQEHLDKQEYIRGVEKSLDDNSDVVDPGPPPANAASDREHRVWRRDFARLEDPDSRYSTAELTKGWKAYKQLYAEQAMLRRANYGTEEIVEMVSRLPNLKHVAISNYYEQLRGNVSFDKTYRDTLLRPSGDDGFPRNSGEPQLFSVIRALHQAGISLETFEADMVSWHILRATGEISEMLRRVFHSLKKIRLRFCTFQTYEWHHPDEYDDNIANEAQECAKAFQ